MSSPTQYFVWARWEVTQTQIGWIKLNGICRTTTSRNWMASMACRRSSSGKSSQESQRWASPKRFKRWRLNWSVNLSHFNGSVNVQWHEMERKRPYRRMCSECYWSFEVCSQVPLRSLVILRDLDWKRHGTRIVLINQTERGKELQEWWYSN